MGLPVPVALAAQAALFAAVHLYQGWNHAVSIAAFGVIAGLIAEWRHSIRPTMIGHSLIDIAASVIPA
jgi:membrane protease YdiL (CAAX protease family)